MKYGLKIEEIAKKTTERRFCSPVWLTIIINVCCDLFHSQGYKFGENPRIDSRNDSRSIQT